MQCDTLNIIGELLSNGRAGLYDLDLNQTMKVQSAGAGFSDLTDYSMFMAIGTPKKGQTLKEVRDLLLAEIEKLKKGDFSDDLLPSVINNYKRSYYKSLDNNQFRAKAFVDAFINNVDWKQEVGKLDRVSKMTKAEIVSFANRFFDNGYAVIYKVQGTDTTIQKVDKPKITPIPTSLYLLILRKTLPSLQQRRVGLSFISKIHRTTSSHSTWKFLSEKRAIYCQAMLRCTSTILALIK